MRPAALRPRLAAWRRLVLTGSAACALLAMGAATDARARADAVEAPTARAATLGADALDALRQAAWSLEPETLRRGGIEALVARAARLRPDLPVAQRHVLERALVEDPLLRLRVAEILEVGGTWSQLSGEHVVVWWPPPRESADVIPPSTVELRSLDALVQASAERYGVEPPRGVPVRLDPATRPPRVFPRSDLRWGVVGTTAPENGQEAVRRPGRVDRAALARVVLSDLGDLPALQQALAELHGRCGDDAVCRSALLDEARRVVIDAGHVPFERAIRAGHLSGRDDPALASLLLAVDRLERRVAPRSFAALIEALTPESSGSDLWNAVVAAFGESPRKIDREVLRELAAWDRGRRP